MTLTEKIDDIQKHTESFDIPMIKKEKFKKLNLKTNRMKTSRKQRFLQTTVRPEDRTLKNLPRYADSRPMVRFQDWLLISPEKTESHNSVPTFGKSEADGRWYGWSHRAIASFKEGDKVVAKDYIGRDYIKKEPPFTIKSDEEAREMAIAFAREVA